MNRIRHRRNRNAAKEKAYQSTHPDQVKAGAIISRLRHREEINQRARDKYQTDLPIGSIKTSEIDPP